MHYLIVGTKGASLLSCGGRQLGFYAATPDWESAVSAALARLGRGAQVEFWLGGTLALWRRPAVPDLSARKLSALGPVLATRLSAELPSAWRPLRAAVSAKRLLEAGTIEMAACAEPTLERLGALSRAAGVRVCGVDYAPSRLLPPIAIESEDGRACVAAAGEMWLGEVKQGALVELVVVPMTGQAAVDASAAAAAWHLLGAAGNWSDKAKGWWSPKFPCPASDKEAQVGPAPFLMNLSAASRLRGWSLPGASAMAQVPKPLLALAAAVLVLGVAAEGLWWSRQQQSLGHARSRTAEIFAQTLPGTPVIDPIGQLAAAAERGAAQSSPDAPLRLLVAVGEQMPEGSRLQQFAVTASGAEIAGTAPSASAVSDLASALRGLPGIDQVEVREASGAAGSAPFRLSLKLTQGGF